MRPRRVFVLAVSVGVIGWGLAWMRTAHASHGWPSTDGTVVQVRSGAASGRHADLSYEYAVSGVRYVGRRTSLRVVVSADEQRARYAAGQHVTVYYDPAGPGTSLLERGGNRGLVILLSGLCALVSTVWRLRG